MLPLQAERLREGLMKILIVEDDPDATEFFTSAASALGHEDIDTANSGEEALSSIVSTYYDLISLDIQLPGISGLEILSVIRNMCPHTVIAIISGNIPNNISEETAGCADVLIGKPIPLDVFKALLQSTARIAEEMQKIRTLEKPPEIV